MDPEPPEQAHLLADIADHAADVAALTADLIRIPTLNPPGETYRISLMNMWRLMIW